MKLSDCEAKHENDPVTMTYGELRRAINDATKDADFRLGQTIGENIKLNEQLADARAWAIRYRDELADLKCTNDWTQRSRALIWEQLINAMDEADDNAKEIGRLRAALRKISNHTESVTLTALHTDEDID